MAQESWKVDKDETDCEVLKPSSSMSPSSPPKLFLKSSQEIPIQKPERTEIPAVDLVDKASCSIKRDDEPSPKPIRFGNRCSSCQKRVGLTGFRCRCGDLFCGRHRYSDTHQCSFDYKAAGKEEISKANPVIRPAKIIKI